MSERSEIILEGTPEMSFECIRMVAESLNLLGYSYGVRRSIDTPDYAKWDRTYNLSISVFETREDTEEQVGVIKLQLLPWERTLFSVPLRNSWSSPFQVFMADLSAEFHKLGFEYFEEENHE